MSEEKEAIDYLKNDVVYWLDKGKDFVVIDIGENEKLHSILNLIDKQKKEIEELKEKNKNLIFQLKDEEKELIEVTDKIREKIKEIENRRIEEGKCELAIYGFQRDAKIEVLQELLEE